ncbi:MAG: hypothetical protein ABSD20_21880 [Terriglobales bacterium]
MMNGPNQPPAGGGGRGRGRRGRRSDGQGKRGRHKQSGSQQNRHGGIYSAPMDHSYRAALHGNGNQRGRSQRSGELGSRYLQPEPEPLPMTTDDAAPRIFAVVDDMFFAAKITETARKLNVKVEFVKTEKNIFERVGQNGDQKPSLVIFDLNNTSAKPLLAITRLKSKLKKKTTIIGFLSHVQGDLKVKAADAGCDMVLPRSAFSQNLPQLLRRHGAPDEEETVSVQPRAISNAEPTEA